ncbi:hypothetical protein [Streptomyces sp. NPDC059918]|uniref:hypothetical protein n=1 Tax=unclassified Streptomyces TaxID=2593676 RepID=UPI0036688EBC
MTGTVVVRADEPGLGRSGTWTVVVDGVVVGQVDQGTSARFPVAAGTHTVRVAAKDGTRSNTVTVELTEGRDSRVAAQGTGAKAAVLLPLLAAITVPPVYVVASIVLIGVVLRVCPGLLFRVRADGATAHRAVAAEEEHTGTALWWESDPVLAKRFRKAE